MANQSEFTRKTFAHLPKALAARSQFEREFAVSETAVVPVGLPGSTYQYLAPRPVLEPGDGLINSQVPFQLGYLGT